MFVSGANEGSIYCQCMMGIIYHIHYKEYDNAKYWYEKARDNKCIESIYNLGLLSLEINDYDEAKKYFKEGVSLDCKKCEYMLAYIYMKKSESIFKKLAKEDIEDSISILNQFPIKDIDTQNVLLPSFKLIKDIKTKEKYVPYYILDIDEDLENMYERKKQTMIVL